MRMSDLDAFLDRAIPLTCLLCAVLIILTLCFGCSHAQPAPGEVIPCVPVTIYPPLIEKPERPTLESRGWEGKLETPEQIRDFVRAIAKDLAKIVGWALELENEIDKSNAARPEE